MCQLSLAIFIAFAAYFGSAFRQDAQDFGSAIASDVCTQASDESLEIPSDQVEIVFVRHGVSLNNLFKENMFRNLKDMVKLKAKSKDYTWQASSTSKFKSGYAQVCNEEKICGPYFGDAEGRSDLRWEIDHQSQDCLLHPEGEAQAIAKGELLETVLPSGTISGFYTSPLRRTIQTLLNGFKSFLGEPPVTIMPWLHERFKSRSDWAYPGGVTAQFVALYGPKTGASQSTLDQMKADLNTLGDWTVKQGKIEGADFQPVCAIPGVTASQAELVAGGTDTVEGDIVIEDEDESDTEDEGDAASGVGECGGKEVLPYYPGQWSSSPGKEPKKSLKERMDVVRSFLKTLEPGKRYVMVSHGGVGSALLGSYAGTDPDGKQLKGKLANFGVITGRFNPATADPESPETFFENVMTGADRWGCAELPGWRA